MLWRQRCTDGKTLGGRGANDVSSDQSGFTQVFPATELDARDALCGMMTRLRSMGLAEEQIGGIEIALAEVVNNVVEHAYDGLFPGDVQVEACLDLSELTLHVTDRGHALPDGQLPEGKPADLSGVIDDLPEGGFGWFMIRTLTRDIRYNRDDGKNHLHLTFDLVPPAL